MRTLREKVAHLAQSAENVARWAASLAKSWMERHEAHIIGTLLVDGHPRVYHGSVANLPKRYISIQSHEQSPAQIARYEQRKGDLLIAVQELEKEIGDLKEQRKSKPKHITLAETLYPGTELTLFYRPLRSSNFLPEQDV